jgi:hypothetical protein
VPPHLLFLPFHEVYLSATEALCRRPAAFRNPELFARFTWEFADLYLQALDAHLCRRPPGGPWIDYFDRPSPSPLIQFFRGAWIHVTIDLRNLLRRHCTLPPEDFHMVTRIHLALLKRFTAHLARYGSTAARIAHRVPLLARCGFWLVTSWRIAAYRESTRRA